MLVIHRMLSLLAFGQLKSREWIFAFMRILFAFCNIYPIKCDSFIAFASLSLCYIIRVCKDYCNALLNLMMYDNKRLVKGFTETFSVCVGGYGYYYARQWTVGGILRVYTLQWNHRFYNIVIPAERGFSELVTRFY